MKNEDLSFRDVITFFAFAMGIISVLSMFITLFLAIWDIEIIPKVNDSTFKLFVTSLLASILFWLIFAILFTLRLTGDAEED